MTNSMQYCYNCGVELGVFTAWKDDLNTCGKLECEREAREQLRSEEDAHKAEREEDAFYRRNFGNY